MTLSIIIIGLTLAGVFINFLINSKSTRQKIIGTSVILIAGACASYISLSPFSFNSFSDLTFFLVICGVSLIIIYIVAYSFTYKSSEDSQTEPSSVNRPVKKAADENILKVSAVKFEEGKSIKTIPANNKTPIHQSAKPKISTKKPQLADDFETEISPRWSGAKSNITSSHRKEEQKGIEYTAAMKPPAAIPATEDAFKAAAVVRDADYNDIPSMPIQIDLSTKDLEITADAEPASDVVRAETAYTEGVPETAEPFEAPITPDDDTAAVFVEEETAHVYDTATEDKPIESVADTDTVYVEVEPEPAVDEQVAEAAPIAYDDDAAAVFIEEETTYVHDTAAEEEPVEPAADTDTAYVEVEPEPAVDEQVAEAAPIAYDDEAATAFIEIETEYVHEAAADEEPVEPAADTDTAYIKVEPEPSVDEQVAEAAPITSDDDAVAAFIEIETEYVHETADDEEPVEPAADTDTSYVEVEPEPAVDEQAAEAVPITSDDEAAVAFIEIETEYVHEAADDEEPIEPAAAMTEAGITLSESASVADMSDQPPITEHSVDSKISKDASMAEIDIQEKAPQVLETGTDITVENLAAPADKYSTIVTKAADLIGQGKYLYASQLLQICINESDNRDVQKQAEMLTLESLVLSGQPQQAQKKWLEFLNKAYDLTPSDKTKLKTVMTQLKNTNK